MIVNVGYNKANLRHELALIDKPNRDRAQERFRRVLAGISVDTDDSGFQRTFVAKSFNNELVFAVSNRINELHEGGQYGLYGVPNRPKAVY